MSLKNENFLREENTRHQFHPMIHPLLSRAHPPQIITGGDGVYVTDIDGKTYVDGLGGLWNVNVGHNRKEIKDAIIAQMDMISYYSSFAGTTTGPSIELSAKIIEMVAAFARDEGVIVRPVGPTIILSPPLIINAEQIDKIIDALTEAFTRLEKRT